MRQQVHAVHGFAAAFGIEVVAGEPLGADDVQPMALAVEGAAGLILAAARPLRAAIGLSMSLRSIHRHEDGAFHEGFADGSHGGGGLFASFFGEVGEGSGADGTVEEFGKGFAETLKGDELIAAEVEGGLLLERLLRSRSARRVSSFSTSTTRFHN